jgi:hypothetical protein
MDQSEHRTTMCTSLSGLTKISKQEMSGNKTAPKLWKFQSRQEKCFIIESRGKFSVRKTDD